MSFVKSINKLKRSSLSMGDDIGTVYLSEGRVLRGINTNSVAVVKELLDSGLVEELVAMGLFPETVVSSFEMEGYPIVIEHEKIAPEIYPFEWSPEMLRRAALCILDVNECANRYGYELKDAHPYNIMFKSSKPIFIDFGSFVKCESPAAGWGAYNEFMASFYYPLLLCGKGFNRLYKLLYFIRGDAAGIAEMAALVNPIFSLMGPKLSGKFFRLIAIYRLGPRLEVKKINAKLTNPFLRLIARIILKSKWLPFRSQNINKLKEKVRSIKLRQKSAWGDYHEQSGFYELDGNISLSPRMDWIKSTVADLQPRSIVELAGNQGVLSRVLSEVPGVKRVICTDYDENSIDALLLNSRCGDRVSMACFNFMIEGWQAPSNERAERLRSEMVIALAVTHHLLLTQGFSIDSVLSAIVKFSSKYLIIEFMPLGLWDGESAKTIPSWYCEEWFVSNLSRYAEIMQRVELEPNRIAFVAKVESSI